MTFKVTYSSSPPSTPDRRGNNYFAASNNPSTTPAGPPPPSSARSYTPAGLPPSSILGSSRSEFQYGAQPLPSLKFGKTPSLNPPKSFDSPSLSPGDSQYFRSSGPQRSGLSNEYKPPATSRSHQIFQDEDVMEEDAPEGSAGNSFTYGNRNFGETNYSLDQIESMADEMGEDSYDQDMNGIQFGSSISNERKGRRGNEFGQSAFDPFRQRDLRRSVENPVPGIPSDSMFGRIAKDIAKQTGPARVDESDDLIIRNESLIQRLYREGIKADLDDDAFVQVQTIIPNELLDLWADYDDRTRSHNSEEYSTVIGPGPRASKFANANFLASLLVSLHHPSPSDAQEVPRSRRGSFSRGSGQEPCGHLKPIPLLLLEWMDDYHDPYPSHFEEVQSTRPSPSSHKLFWNTLLNSLLRGKLVAVVNNLKHAGWQYARRSQEEITANVEEIGYSGRALANIEKVVGDAISLLQECPAIKGNWDTDNAAWTNFRIKTQQSLFALKRFSEPKKTEHETAPSFQADNFGMSRLSKSYSGVAQRAASQVPWDIYQNLIILYNLLLGDGPSIIENSQDWCEATIGLAVWWNQGKNYHQAVTSRPSSRHRQEPKATGPQAYFDKIARSFYLATNEDAEFHVNTLDSVEVGLACIFEFDIEAVVAMLRSWSGPISAGVVDVASVGGWMPPPNEQQKLLTMESFDQDDMDLLGINPPSDANDNIKDHTLITYADGLAQRGKMEGTSGSGHKVVREGWELAIEVLGRLDSPERSEKEVGRVLSDLPLESSVIVDKLWRLLNELSMTAHAENVAEGYANTLSESTHKYGEALWYYALAHKASKVKDVLDLLMSLSLLHSIAYPAQDELDSHLKRLISSPKEVLTEMSRLDYESAQLLHRMLSGYATLRRFYDLRDEDIKQSTTEKQRTPSYAKKAESAVMLIAIITSSDDNIRGGLYDEERGAVVSVDFLLTLLGESLVFINQPHPLITSSQIDILLKAIEDIQTVGTRVYSACDEFFQTVIASAQGLKGSNPMDLLKKQSSSMSGTSSFSLVGSSMLASQFQRSIGSSGVLVKGNVQRGWDWRRGLHAGTSSQDVLKMLRLGLAKEVARACIMEADGKF